MGVGPAIVSEFKSGNRPRVTSATATWKKSLSQPLEWGEHRVYLTGTLGRRVLNVSALDA